MNATEYLKLWEKHRVWERLRVSRHQRRLKRCAELAVGETAIDVGCAYGHSTSYMAGFRPGRWAGLDFDAAAVAKARRLFPELKFFYAPNYGLVRATGGETFDTVVCSEVIEHAENDSAFVAALLPLARKRVVMTTPCKKVKSAGHLRLYTEDSLRDLFRGHSPAISKECPFFYLTLDVL